MKRIFAVLLCLCLFLTACSNEPQDTTPPTSTAATTQATTQATTEATTQATTQATTAAPTETTAPPLNYRHPLNGTPMAEPWVGRPTAVVFNNIVDCLPQHGIGQTDLVYEYETEGGITRMLGFFTDLTDVGSIGPVRSSRSFFNSTALAYGAPIIHCGGSTPGRNGHYSDNGAAIKNWAHIDETYNGSYFFRDQSRLSSGYSREHTLFTTGSDLTQALSDKNLATPNPADTDYGLLFEDDIVLGGETANSIVITFRGSKTTTMTYNPEIDAYALTQYKRTQIDGNTNKPVTYTNVLVLYTQQWMIHDGYYWRSFYNLTDSGSGYYAYGGEIIPIQWHREELYGPFTFTLEDGTPLALAAGTTYIGVASDSKTIQYN